MSQIRSLILIVCASVIIILTYPWVLLITRNRPKRPKLLVISLCLYLGFIAGVVSALAHHVQARQLIRRPGVTVVLESLQQVKDQRPDKTRLIDEIRTQARRYNVPPGLALAIANWETGIEHWTREGTIKGADKNSSQVGIGVFQLLPGTATDMGVDPYDPYQNIEGGVRYIAHLMGLFRSVDTSNFKVPKKLQTRFEKDPVRFLAIAAYRAGFDRIIRSNGIPDHPTRTWSQSLWESVMQYVPGVFDSSFRMN